MLVRKSSLLLLGIALLSVVGIFSLLKTVQAKKKTGREAAIVEKQEQLEQGIAPPKEPADAPPPEYENPQISAEDLTTLDADRYRPELVEIDRLIFENQPFGDERRSLLVARLEAFSERVRSASDNRFIALEADELKTLAVYAQNYPAAAPRINLENQWMRIRNNLFDDRSWFARSAADLDALKAAEKAAEAVKSPVTPPPSAPLILAHILEGRWRVSELYGNGRLRSDPELSDAAWIFRGHELVIQSPDGNANRYTFEKIEDERGAALRVESYGSNNGPSEKGWMIYEFGERELKLAFYDGLGARPDSFTPTAGKADPMLTVVILQRGR